MLPIYEQFYAWQGEGCHMGRAAFFIRTFGCPIKCPWCDSAGTWHPDWVPKTVERVEESHLAVQAAATRAEFVVVTGGEPTIHDLSTLTERLTEHKLPAHIETSGAFPIRGKFSWVTLSPKWSKLPLPENLKIADEIKIIVEDCDSIDRWWKEIEPYVTDQVLWLHPEWSKRQDNAVLESISLAVKKYGRPFRAGYQLHRLFNVDSLDVNSRPNVPLGGNVTLGY